MKLSFKHLVVVSILSVLVVGCGKDEKKKSGSSTSSVKVPANNLNSGAAVNNILTGTSSGAAAEKKFTDWLATVQSGGVINTRVTYQKVECAQFLGSQCLTTSSTKDIYWPGSVPRSYNVELANLLTSDVAAGFTREVVSQSGAIVKIDFSRTLSNGKVERKIYYVDSSFHAAVNPVEYHRTVNNKPENKKCFSTCRFQ